MTSLWILTARRRVGLARQGRRRVQERGRNLQQSMILADPVCPRPFRHVEPDRRHLAGQLASLEWWSRQGSHFPSVPPEATMRDVLRDLFGALSLPAAFSGHRQSDASPAPDVGVAPDPWGFAAGMPGCAPAASLASR